MSATVWSRWGSTKRSSVPLEDPSGSRREVGPGRGPPRPRSRTARHRRDEAGLALVGASPPPIARPRWRVGFQPPTARSGPSARSLGSAPTRSRRRAMTTAPNPLSPSRPSRANHASVTAGVVRGEKENQFAGKDSEAPAYAPPRRRASRPGGRSRRTRSAARVARDARSTRGLARARDDLARWSARERSRSRRRRSPGRCSRQDTSTPSGGSRPGDVVHEQHPLAPPRHRGCGLAPEGPAARSPASRRGRAGGRPVGVALPSRQSSHARPGPPTNPSTSSTVVAATNGSNQGT